MWFFVFSAAEPLCHCNRSQTPVPQSLLYLNGTQLKHSHINYTPCIPDWHLHLQIYMPTYTPTMIHHQAGRDVLVSAATGSGKTLAYLAPIVDRLAAQQPRVTREAGTRCLVIAPTRELVLQIQAVLAMLLKRFAYLVRSVLCVEPNIVQHTCQGCVFLSGGFMKCDAPGRG